MHIAKPEKGGKVIATTVVKGRKTKAKTAAVRPSDKAKDIVTNILDEAKGEHIVTLDLSGKTSIADYMVVASGTSARHVSTLAHRVSEALKEAGFEVATPEGMENADWVVVDAGDVIIHLFRPEIRELYHLEKMWSVAIPTAEMEVVS